MTQDVKTLYEKWLAELEPEDAMRKELLEASEADIKDRFYKTLSFGTAGLRGKMGAGVNRMNRFTVMQATQGFADYLNGSVTSPSIAISYDSRINSLEFARAAAGVMAANGIKTYLYPALTPTPMLSFAVRHLHCAGGIMVTASHNSKEYNGYKVYESDGCQIDETAAEDILRCISAVDMFSGVKQMDFTAALNKKMIGYISSEVNEAFFERAMGRTIEREALPLAGLRVLYTPLNGAGLIPVTTVLRRLGLQNLSVVPEQEHPDGTFPTCPQPNPEFKEAFTTAMTHASRLQADIVIASDPDADRVACAVFHQGAYYYPTGNEMGILFIDYVLSRAAAHGALPDRPVIVKSIVSTPMADTVAAAYGCKTDSVLTGFKNIAGRIRYYEDRGELERYVMGFEESIGFMFGSFVRDKDAVTSIAVLCEMASWYKLRGQTLRDVLDTIYKRFGHCMQRTVNYIYEGEQGSRVMQSIMAALRGAPPEMVGGKRVLSMTDLQSGQTEDFLTHQKSSTDLPKGNVLLFTLADSCSFVVRPSGTEPKLKLYCSALGSDEKHAESILEHISRDMDKYCKK